MVAIAFTPSFVHMATETVGMNCGPFSVRTFVGIPRLLTKWSRRIMATGVSVFMSSVSPWLTSRTGLRS